MAGALSTRGTAAGVLTAFGGGAALATQAAMNGALSVPLQTAFAATSVSFMVGSATLALLSLHPLGLKKAPVNGKPVRWWMWVAPGVVGAYFVSMGTLLGPRLGFSLLFVCVVLGQLVTSLLIDYFGMLDIPKSPITGTKLAAMAVVLGGAVMAVVERLEVGSSPGLTVAYVALSILAGASTSIQVPITAAFTKRIGTLPHRTACLAFSVGCAIVVVIWAVVLAVDESARELTLEGAEWWMFVGGALGAGYVAASVALGPVLGIALFFISVVAGQLTMSLLIDSLGLLNTPSIPVTALRVCGVVLVFVGAAAFRFLPADLFQCSGKGRGKGSARSSRSSRSTSSDASPTSASPGLADGRSFAFGDGDDEEGEARAPGAALESAL